MAQCLSLLKTKKANPEGGISQTVECAQLQENFVAKYTAQETPSTMNLRLKLVEIIIKLVAVQVVSVNHFNILPVPSSFRLVLCYNESGGPVSYYREGAVSAPGSGVVKALQPGSDLSTQSGTKRKKGPAHWNHCDLAVQCVEGMCQVHMGTFPVLLRALMCEDTDSMRCAVLAPKGLKGQLA